MAARAVSPVLLDGTAGPAARTPSVRPAPKPGRAVPAKPDVFGSTAIAAINLPVSSATERVEGASASGGCGPVCRKIAEHITGPVTVQTLQAVNSAVNDAIRYREDADLYGRPEYWASANQTFARGAGDCEDIAIAKMALLTALGIDPRDLFLVVLKDTRRDLLHAVLVVRTGRDFHVLDNVTDTVRTHKSFADYRPMYTVSAEGAWVHGVTLASN